MFEQIAPKALAGNVFSMIGDEWMLITAGTAERCNTMTASWGGMGIMWGRPVAVCGIRPQRYTRSFVEEQDYFTLSFFGEEYRQALTLCGSKSGRDVDKIQACGFTVAQGEGGAPYFEQARLVLVCRRLYQRELDPEGFVDRQPIEAWYPGGDYHKMYVGEIVQVLRAV